MLLEESQCIARLNVLREDEHPNVRMVRPDSLGGDEPLVAVGRRHADVNPTWSPDVTKIAFAKGQNGDVDSNIYFVNGDGSGLTQVTHTGGSNGPDWGTHPLVR
jgi:hypothetical protein